MTDNDLKGVEERANAATPGPWNESKDSWDGTEYSVIRGPEGEIVLQEPTSFSVYPSASFVTAEGMEADIAFAAHAREDVPKLIAEIRRLRKLVK